MGLDIRLPMGLMFTVFGVLLTGFGLFSSRDIYKASLGININLIWGIVLLVTGAIMLLLGRKASAAAQEAADQTKAQGAGRNH